MKARLCIAFLAVLMGGMGFLMAQTNDSRITEVTVYTDRAMVTREAAVALKGGDQSVVIDNLPQSIDANSIQVSGKGAFTLRDIKFTTKYLAATNSERQKALLAEKKNYEESAGVKADGIKEAESERVFLDNISKKLTAPSSEPGAPVLDPEKWISMVKFYREKLTSIDAEIRLRRKEIADLQEEINRVARELQALGNLGGKTMNQLEVSVGSAAAGSCTLIIKYIVRGCSWKPDYAIRADSAAKKVSVTYNAQVRQTSGEDWSGISLTLSTARPQVNGRLPELNPWYLDVFRPAPPMSVSASTAMPAAAPPPAPMAKGRAEEARASVPEPAPEMEYETAQTQAGATSVLFSLPGKNTILSDNKEYRVTVAIVDLAGKFSYSAVPKLSPFAYLRANVNNTSDYPFLPGVTHVFLDGAYVTDASIALVAPGQEFFADLGIDESIKVERKLVKRNEEKPGVFNAKILIGYEYALVLKSNKKTAETIYVSDQLPVPRNDQIAVALLLPVYTKDTEILKKTDQGNLTWTVVLEPGKEQVVPFKFTVEYPKGTNITGIE